MAVNFAMMKSQHRALEKRLQLYFAGKGTISETESFSHEDCDVGKWLYSEGMIKYGNLPEMLELEEVHVELHAIIRKISSMKQSGRIVATREFEKVELINKKIIALLTDIEVKIKIK